MENHNTPPYFTNAIIRCSVIESELNSLETLSSNKVDDVLEELSHLCDQDGVVVFFMENSFHMKLVNIFNALDSKQQRIVVKILTNVMRFDDDVKTRLKNDRDFMLNLTGSYTKSIQSQAHSSTHEICLNFLVEIFEKDFKYIVPIEQQELLLQSIVDSFSWDNPVVVYCSICLLNMGFRCESLVIGFLKSHIENMISRLSIAGMNHKIGVIICKFINNSLETTECSSIYPVLVEIKLDHTLMKILFEERTTLTAEYYLVAITLLNKLLFFNIPEVQSTHSRIYSTTYVRKVIEAYQSTIAVSLLGALRTHGVPKIFIAGLKILYLTFTMNDTRSTICNEPDQQSWLSFIHEIITSHFDNIDLIRWSFKVLYQMFTTSKVLSNFVGNDSEKNQIPIDSVLIQLFYTQNNLDFLTFQASCDLLSVLSANSEKIQNKFLTSNLHMIIHWLAVRFTHNMNDLNVEYQVRIAEVNAQRSLIIFNLPAKELFFYEDNQYKEAKAFLSGLLSKKQHYHNENMFEVISVYLLFLASLVEYSPFKYDLILGKELNLSCILICQTCSSNESIIEALQELLIVLSGSEFDTEVLLNIWPFEGWLTVSSNLINCYAIQKNTMIFLQLNSSSIEKNNRSRILLKIADFINKAIKRFDESAVIRVEAFVLIQIMITQYPEFLRYCLEYDLENIIYETVSSHVHGDIYNVGVQALFLIIESNQTREKIVEKAVKQGLVDLLELMFGFGTDISNISMNLLNMATRQKSDKQSLSLVSLLLDNGCRPELDAIRNSLVMENIETAGLLLSYYGINDMDRGSIINWTGLGLEALPMCWLIRLAQGIESLNEDRKVMLLVRRMKHESMNIMKLKTWHQRNKSSSIVQSRYPFTQDRTLETNIGGYVYHTKKSKEDTPKASKEYEELSNDSPLISESFMTLSLGGGRKSRGQVPLFNFSVKREKNAQSVDDLLVNICLNPPKRTNYEYIPLSEELREFFSIFRSGSNFCYHSSDPRCMIADKSQRPKFSAMLNLVNKTSLNTFCRMRSSTGEHNDVALATSLPFMDRFSDDLSETHNNITSLFNMDLTRNNITSLDAFCEISTNLKLIKMFETMTVLKLCNNRIEILPLGVFKNLVSIEHLDLSSNILREVPWDVFRYSKLNHLNLCKNKIKAFKVSDETRDDLKLFGRRKMLLQLLLSENDIQDFSLGTLSLFVNLERLDIHSVPLEFKNDDVFPLPNLKKFNARNGVNGSIGKNLLNSSREIQSIDLSENELYPLEEMFPINLSHFENLTDVNVSHNNLSCRKPFFIPKCILKLPKLQVLNISHNNIVEFPACSMWTSSVLRDLDFSHNAMHTMNLLNADTNFKSLQNLDVSYNKLKQLPPEIGQLSYLNLLNISHNPSLTTLPDEIGNLKNHKMLNSLIIDGLNLNIKSHLSANPGVIEILKYYHHRLKNSVEYFGLKIMVLGNGGRGKTTLLESLQGKSRERQSITIGINVSKWRFQGKFNGRPANFKFSCWDLAGQEDFYSSHECFISQRALYLVVFDLTKGSNEIDTLKPWLLNLRSQAPQAPIIVIGTHLDKIKEENRQNQCLFLRSVVYKLCIPPAFPKIVQFIAVDARRPNKTIDHLRNVIIKVLENHHILNEPIIGEKQPASYLKLEEILQETVKKLPEEYPILFENDIKDIAHKNNLVLDDIELKQALQFLHNCGSIVHFDDVINKLNNLYFINPQWLCSMMAKIITLKALNPYVINGTMKLLDFNQLFVRQQFMSPLPNNINIETYATQCLKILEKFDVVFQRSSTEIIIPSRLPVARPPTIKIDEQVSKIRRVFEFFYLPTGFWPRLVARISSLSQAFSELFSAHHLDHEIWKQGVIMSWQKSIYMLLERREGEREIIDLSVTMSELGLKIMVQIIDCIEVLIEEWYPGLMDSDITGNKMMKSFALCPNCEYKFNVVDIMQTSNVSDHIECGQCLGSDGMYNKVAIRVIAPDIVLGDLPSYLIINPSLLTIEKNPEMLVGAGGNGSVYRGRYNNASCAVKYLNDTSSPHDQPSYRLLRQEIDILRRLRHPSLINLIAVDREKIILELAEVGDLDFVLKNTQLGRRYLQRVSCQIIDGIEFLHDRNILYRDLKMHNVLVFSLELSAAINVKLSDYGISRVITYFGFINMQGTPGYIAPEVVRKCLSYNLQSDIYSYGIVLFNIATRGKHPSDYKTHWRAGASKELISTFGSENWPRMQECIDICTENSPDDRPFAKDIISFISCPSFITIKAVWTLTKQTRIECMVTKVNDDGRVEVLLANGNQYKQEVRLVDILSGKTKGKSFVNKTKRARILCTALLDNLALLGTHLGQMWIYNYLENSLIETKIIFPDSLLAITVMKISDNLRILVVGLANGTVSYSIGSSNIMDLHYDHFITISLGIEPVRNVCQSHDQIFVTCGPMIFKLVYSPINETLLETKIVEISSRDVDNLIKCFFSVTEYINNVAHTSFYFSIRNQSLIYNHDDQGNQLKIPINCDQLMREKYGSDEKLRNTKIMCMTGYGDNRYLAVGTGSGHLIVMDHKINYITIISLYRLPIICLQHSKININSGKKTYQPEANMEFLLNASILERSGSMESLIRNRSRSSWLIVVGNGYKSINRKDDDGAVLLLLSDDLSKVSRQIDEHLNFRQTLK